MKRLHLVLGIVLVVLFLLTGQYMEYVQNPTLPDGPRVLYRSRHIYILMNALINISLGLYLQYPEELWRRRVRIIGSTLILLAPLFLLAGFFYEPPRGAEQTIVAPYGVFATAIGIVQLQSRESDFDRAFIGSDRNSVRTCPPRFSLPFHDDERDVVSSACTLSEFSQ